MYFNKALNDLRFEGCFNLYLGWSLERDDIEAADYLPISIVCCSSHEINDWFCK